MTLIYERLMVYDHDQADYYEYDSDQTLDIIWLARQVVTGPQNNNFSRDVVDFPQIIIFLDAYEQKSIPSLEPYIDQLFSMWRWFLILCQIFDLLLVFPEIEVDVCWEAEDPDNEANNY